MTEGVRTHSRLHHALCAAPADVHMKHVEMVTEEHVRRREVQSVRSPLPGGEEEGSGGGGRLSGSLLLVSVEGREGLQGVPLANGAQWLAGRQPLVDALQMEAMLAGQHSQLLPIPAAFMVTHSGRVQIPRTPGTFPEAGLEQ